MASAQEAGEIQLIKFNPTTKQRTPLKVQRSEILGYVAPASRTNPQEQDEKIQFLEGSLAVDENEWLEVWVEADAADIIESEESKLHLDVTLVDKKTGQELPSAFSFENMTGFTAAGTVDITLVAGEPRRIAKVQASSGQQIVLGRKDGRGKFYCYLGDDTA